MWKILNIEVELCKTTVEFTTNRNTCNLQVTRASKLKDHEIGRSPYLFETQSGDFYGNFSRRKSVNNDVAWESALSRWLG